MQAIDYLCGPFTRESIRDEYLEGDKHEAAIFTRLGRASELRDLQPEQFVAHLSELGFEKILVVAIKALNYWTGQPIFQGSTTDRVIELQQRFPGHVFGLYGIDVRERMAGVDALERAVRDHGFKGVHIHPHSFGIPPSHAWYFPYYAKCQELGIPVVITMGQSMSLMPMEPGRPSHLDEVALYFPDLRIVCAHTGYPWVEEAIALASKHANLYLGTSAHAPKYWKPEMVQFLNSRRGRGKVMFGSDWPVVRHQEALQQIDALELKPESTRALLHDVAAAVFKLD